MVFPVGGRGSALLCGGSPPPCVFCGQSLPHTSRCGRPWVRLGFHLSAFVVFVVMLLVGVGVLCWRALADAVQRLFERESE